MLSDTKMEINLPPFELWWNDSSWFIFVCFPFLDFLFSNLNSPSMIASAAICATFQNLRHQFGSLCPTNYELIQKLTDITGVDEVNNRLQF